MARGSSAAGVPPRPLVAAVLAAVLLNGGCARAGTPPGEPLPPALGLTDLGSEDSIDAVDLAALPEGLALAWRERDRPEGGGVPRRTTRVATWDAGTRTWSRAGDVPLGGGAPPRLVADGAVLHLLGGGSLGHFTRRGAAGWDRREPLLPDGGFGALACDALPWRGGLLVAVLARRGRDGPLRLDLVRRDASATSVRMLVELESSGLGQPAPRLLATADGIHLLAAVNLARRRTVSRGGRSAQEMTTRARLLHLWSSDGAVWSGPTDLLADDPPTMVEDLAALLVGGRPLALFTGVGLRAVGVDPADAAPIALAPSGAAPAGSRRSWSVSAVSGPAPAIAWVDQRYRGSRRRWWKPLGGWPWSDAPDLVDSDLWVLRLDAGSLPASARPVRLTPPGARVDDARLVLTGGRLHAVWSGRRQVGTAPGSAGAPPHLFHRDLGPAERAATGPAGSG